MKKNKSYNHLKIVILGLSIIFLILGFYYSYTDVFNKDIGIMKGQKMVDIFGRPVGCLLIFMILASVLKLLNYKIENNNIMKLRNQVQLIGNLGEKIELKTLESGKKVVNFSLATNESYKNAQGEKVDKVSWHRCVAWGKTAEIISEYTDKGSEIAIQGKLTYGSYEKEEVKITYAEVLIEEVLLLGNKKSD